MNGPWTAAVRVAGALRWYGRELLGETKYERYRERLLREHPDAVPLTERAFWREHARAAEASPGARCC